MSGGSAGCISAAAERRQTKGGRASKFVAPLPAALCSGLAGSECPRSVAGGLGLVGPVVLLVRRLFGPAVAVVVAVQLARQCPEVRIVSAVLQVAGDLRLLGFSSAAPH